MSSPTHGTALSRLARAALGALLAALLASFGIAAEGDGVSTTSGRPTPLRYREWYAPADRSEEWPRGDDKLFPIKRDEIESMIRILEEDDAARREILGRQFSVATYEARLVDASLVDGTASLRADHDGDGPTRISLKESVIPILDPRWADRGDEEVVLGVDGVGRTELLVDQAGRIEFKWSLAGRRETSGDIAFDAVFPPALATSLKLWLPERATLEADHGVVRSTNQRLDGQRLWRIDIGGGSRVRLRVSRPFAAGADDIAPRVTQSIHYACSIRGVEVTARCVFDPYDAPPTRLVLQLDPALKPREAVYDGQSLPIVQSSTESDGAATLEFDLPASVAVSRREFRLTAFAPLTLNEAWRLPTVRCKGDVFWQQTTATVLVDRPLVLRRLALDGARQSYDGALSATRSGESAVVKYFRQDGSIEVLLSVATPTVVAESRSLVEFAEEETRAVTSALFSVDEGCQFMLEGEIAPEWVIDSVQVEPEDSQSYSAVEEDESGRPSRLVVRLGEPLRAADDIRLNIVSHRVHSSSIGGLTAAELVPVRFKADRHAHRYVAVAGAKAMGEDAPLLRDPQLLPIDRGLAEPPPDMFFDEVDGQIDVTFIRKQLKPDFDARVQSTFTVSDGSVFEEHVLRCVPSSRRVERVVVARSPADETPLEWTIETESDAAIRVTRIDSEGDESKDAPDEDRWEIQLLPSRSGPFSIRGRRVRTIDGPTSMSLIRVPEATKLDGEIRVVTDGDAGIRIDCEGASPVPPGAVGVDAFTSGHRVVRAAFRYEDHPREVFASDAAARPSLTITPVDGDSTIRLAWIWRQLIESAYQADGATLHRVTCWVENQGAATMRFDLPPDVSIDCVRDVWIDGRTVAWRTVETDGRAAFEVDLPRSNAFPAVFYRFDADVGGLGAWTTLRPPACDADAPILNRSWRVWIPDGHRAIPGDFEMNDRSGAWAETTWRGDPVAAIRSAWREFSTPEERRTLVRERARTVLGHFAEVMRESSSRGGAPAVDWGRMLADAAEGVRDSNDGRRVAPLELVVEPKELARVGITPRTVIRLVNVAEEMEPSHAGLELLESVGLAMILHDEALVITSSFAAASRDEISVAAPGETLPWMLTGPTHDLVSAAVEESTPEARFVRVSDWGSEFDGFALPWEMSRIHAAAPLDARGWTAVEMSADGQPDMTLSVVDSDSLELTRWLAFLFLFFVGRQRLLRGTALAAAAGILFSMKWFMPLPLAPMLSGAVSGALCGLGVQLTAIRTTRERRVVRIRTLDADASESSSTVGSSVGTKLLLVVLFTAGAASLAMGEEPGVQTPQDGGVAERLPLEYHPIFIPVDEEGNVVGERNYISERFHKLLRDRVRDRIGPPRSSIIRSARYDGALDVGGLGDRIVMEAFTMAFDVQVLAETAIVRIPSNGYSPIDASVDDRPVRWNEVDGGLEFELKGPGRSQLRIVARPTADADNRVDRFKISVPPVPDSRLTLRTPPSIEDVRVPTARGEVILDRAESEILADLGPSADLEVVWDAPSNLRASAPVVECNELLWLKVQPGGTAVLQAKFMYRTTDDPIKDLRVLVDPHLQQQRPPKCEGAAIASSRTLPGPSGSGKILAVSLREPVEGQIVLEAEFVVKGFAEGGRLRLPIVRSLDAYALRRWMAVSVDSSFEPPTPGASWMSVAAPTFQEAWGVGDGDLVAFELEEDSRNWSIDVWPRAMEFAETSRQDVDIVYGRDSVLVEYSADLEPTDRVFQYELTAPEELRVDRIEVLDAQIEQVLRWTRIDPTTIGVFLREPLADRHSIRLTGKMPMTVGDSLVPVVQMIADDAPPLSVLVYREPDVTVATVDATDDSPATDISPLVEQRRGLATIALACRTSEPSTFRKTVRVLPNQRLVEAKQLTILSYDANGNLEVECRFDLNVDRGVLDRLEISLPNSVVAGRCELPPTVQVESPASSDGRPLALRLNPPVEDVFRFKMRLPLRLNSGEPVSAPNIRLLGIDTTERTLVLPTMTNDLENLNWRVDGAERSESLPEGAVGHDAYVAYDLFGDSFEAVLAPNLGEPTVHAMDVRAAWTAGGRTHCVAAIDLRPSHLRECLLTLPRDHELIQLTVDGAATIPVREAPDRWRVVLGDSRAPQRLEVIYRGTIAPPTRRAPVEFVMPRLDDPDGKPFDVVQTFWCISAPRGFRADDAANVSLAHHEMAKLRSMSLLMNAAERFPVDDPRQLSAWYGVWARRWAEAVQHVRALSAASGDSLRDEIDSLEAVQRAMASELRLDDVLQREINAVGRTDQPALLWEHACADADCSIHGQIENPDDGRVEIVYTPVVTSPFLPRLLATCVMLLLTGSTVFAAGNDWIATFYRRWPHLAGVAVGLIWMLWLWPSVLGLLLIVITFLSMMRSGWRPARESHSTIHAFRAAD